MEELWNSIFTPGATPTLLLATNLSFAALQALLFTLLVATYSYHFLILSLLCAGLWTAINWFVRELQLENAKAASQKQQVTRARSPEVGSDTETELDPQTVGMKATLASEQRATISHDMSLDKAIGGSTEVRRRRSQGESSGYVSTDSEWEKVSEGENKS